MSAISFKVCCPLQSIKYIVFDLLKNGNRRFIVFLYTDLIFIYSALSNCFKYFLTILFEYFNPIISVSLVIDFFSSIRLRILRSSTLGGKIIGFSIFDRDFFDGGFLYFLTNLCRETAI